MDSTYRSKKAAAAPAEEALSLQNEFVLSSHDFGDSKDRVCTMISRPKGQADGSIYLLVEITPVLRTSFWDEAECDFDRFILSLIGHGTIDDIGKKDVLVDIVLCPSYSGGTLDERACSRIGTGSLHTKD